jgi:large subunit ribosomal protein L24
MYIKSNDTVEVIAGNGKGTRGKVLAINRDKGRITVEGINRAYKHVRRSQKNPQGGRLNKEMPIDISNVLLFCNKCGKGVRVGARIAKDGSKERFCKKCESGLGQVAPARTKKTAAKA